MALPVSRQPDGARRLLEAAVAQQLGVQAELHVLEHELGELAVQLRTDAVLDDRRVDRDGRIVGALTLRRTDQREHREEDEEASWHGSSVSSFLSDRERPRTSGCRHRALHGQPHAFGALSIQARRSTLAP
jgi:hypothetical protein